MERYLYKTAASFDAFAKEVTAHKGYRLHSWNFGATGAVAYVMELDDVVAKSVNRQQRRKQAK